MVRVRAIVFLLSVAGTLFLAFSFKPQSEEERQVQRMNDYYQVYYKPWRFWIGIIFLLAAFAVDFIAFLVARPQ